MACEAEGGIVEADGLKILPGRQLFFVSKQLRHTGHQKQYVGLLDHSVPLQTVKADLVITGAVVRLDRKQVGFGQ